MGCSCSGSVAVSTANTDPHPETQGNEHTIAMTDSMPFSVPRGSDEVLQWLNSINLSEYICNFVDNGLNNMCFIETISIDRNLLKEMGITKIGHQHIIMSAIDLRVSHLRIKCSVIKDDDKWECVKCNNVNGSSDVCLKCGSEFDLNQEHSLDTEATTYIYTKMGVNV
eukprot:245361_1